MVVVVYYNIYLQAPGSKSEMCPKCRGSGMEEQSSGFFSIRTTCRTCHGQGTIISKPCPTCHGEGIV